MIRRVAVVSVAVGLTLVGLIAVSAGAAVAMTSLPAPGASSDLGIAVAITGGPADAAAGGSSSGGAGTSGSGATSGGTSTNPGTQLPTLPAANAFNGTLYVSGLSAEFRPEPNPLAGQMLVTFTVRNVSTETFDSTARFWLTNVVGGVLSESDGIPVAGLQPDETRVIRTTLGGAGQWTVVGAHMELKPPATVAGRSVLPLQRDAVVFALPWVWTALLIVGLAIWLVLLILRSSLVPVAASEAA